ncbi:phosphomannomutase/phosphoglucomutase [Candidatus Peregrinibacteria bacterium]|nr:phosphomannomutase/phosphoglucomutase [Candidatus Peregrinibacteria bacterium]
MKINPNIFRAYDIRGIADNANDTNIDLTEESVYIIGKATASYLIKNYGIKNMAVGCDNRLTGEKLKQAYIKGLIECGIDVSDVGLSVSPMIYWAVCALDFDAGTNITASHNPKEYNGIKIVTKNAHSICADELQEIRKIAESENFTKQEKQGTSKKEDIWPKYKKDLLSRAKQNGVPPPAADSRLLARQPAYGGSLNRKLKIVIDAGNGTAGKFAPELLREFGCEVIELYCDLDGTFPNHEANPEELKNMQDLIQKVIEEKADLGIGFDGDGDRVGIVDEKGHMYSSDFMLLLLARDLAARVKNPKVVFDVKVSSIIIEDMEKHGVVPIMSKTGHSFIENKMKEISAPLAGEVSGHLFFSENYYGFDDALLAAEKIIEIISKSDIPLSQIFSGLPISYATPEFKAPCPDDKKFDIVKNLVEHFTKEYDCVTIDGVRINFDKTSWGAVRASNTSPCLTLRFEARTQNRLQEIKNIMATELKKYPDVGLDFLEE